MAEIKTKPSAVSFASYLASIADEGRRRDCQTLAELLSRIVK